MANNCSAVLRNKRNNRVCLFSQGVDKIRLSR